MEINKKNRKKKKISPDVFLLRLNRLKLPRADEQTVIAIMTEPIKYVFSNCFNLPKVMPSIMKQKNIITGIPLTREKEKTLFLQFNYTKYMMCRMRRRLLKEPKWNRKNIRELLNCNKKQIEIRSKIVTANIGLVLATAKNANFPSIELTELISEGSMALLRASEKFDCSRGFKFSTYACRAILRSLLRAAEYYYRYRRRFISQMDTALENDAHIENKEEELPREWTDEVRFIMQNNLADLSNVEKRIIELRFGLNDESGFLTFEQIGKIIGFTRERIRQIQNDALSNCE